MNSSNTLRLNFQVDDFNTWYVTDENYEAEAADGEWISSSPVGSGRTKCAALLDYFQTAGFDEEINYELIGDN